MNKPNIIVISTKWLPKPFHGDTIQKITEVLKQGQKVLIYINKKWVHTGMICETCGYIPYCKHCDIPIWLYHNIHNHLFWLCSVCQEPYQVLNHCPECGWSIKEYGVGIQFIAQYCRDERWIDPLIISASSNQSKKKITETLESTKQSRIIVATSILSSPRIRTIGLVVFHNADTPWYPDINTNHDHFIFLQHIVTSGITPEIILQTRKPDNTIITSIVQQKPEQFWEHDEIFRLKHNYPPHGELCIISYRNKIESRLFNKINALFHDLLLIKQQEHYSDIELFAIPATIYKMHDTFRYQIIVKWPSIRLFLDQVFIKLKPYTQWFRFDRWARWFL